MREPCVASRAGLGHDPSDCCTTDVIAPRGTIDDPDGMIRANADRNSDVPSVASFAMRASTSCSRTTYCRSDCTGCVDKRSP